MRPVIVSLLLVVAMPAFATDPVFFMRPVTSGRAPQIENPGQQMVELPSSLAMSSSPIAS
jgi:hypothetical protein